jgi:hypothetical protein
MRFTSSPLRAWTIAGSFALLSLVSLAPADAAPRRASGPICDAQMPVARKLPRHPKSFGGPLKRPSNHALAGLQDITARLRRGTHAFPGDTAAAIQNDAPVAGVDAADRLIPSLRPLEIVRSLDLHPRSRAFSPRSPRGPPLSA